MISLRIQHKTTYRYRSPVAFGPHRLMLRPRESREVRLTGFELAVTPEAEVTWAHDVWGNAVATAAFQVMDDTMVIDSAARIDLDAVAWPVFDIAASAVVYPFRCSSRRRRAGLGFGALIVSGYFHGGGTPGRGRCRRRPTPGREDFGAGVQAGSPSIPDQSQRRRRQSDPGRGRARPMQAVPVTGSFVGASDAMLGMTVEVSVTEVASKAPAV